MLTEIERTAHLPARRLPFLHTVSYIATCLGLTLLRHSGRLMPLLLEWLHAHDASTRVAALDALAAVVRVTWPRVSAHASVLWCHVLVCVARAGGGEGRHGQARGQQDEEEQEGEREEVMARRVCELLLCCAREQVVGVQVEGAVRVVCEGLPGRGEEKEAVVVGAAARGALEPVALRRLHDAVVGELSG